MWGAVQSLLSGALWLFPHISLCGSRCGSGGWPTFWPTHFSAFLQQKASKTEVFDAFLELLGRFELREDDFISSSLLLFQHFAYCFCATLVPAYPYSSLFIFSCKGKNKGKTFITYKHSIAFLQQLHLELECVSAYQASPASSKESYNRTTWTLPGFERDAFISGPLVAPLFPPW